MSAVRHACVLIDGCRTFAMLKGAREVDALGEGYRYGAETLGELLHWSFEDFGIPVLSVAMTTRRNMLHRPESMRFIADNIRGYFLEKWLPFFHEREVGVRFIGDRQLFAQAGSNPRDVEEAMAEVERETRNYRKHFFFPMVAYDSAHEYTGLLRGNPGATREELLRSYYGAEIPEVDFLLRTYRPRLSSCIPILVGDYADIYLFTAPFSMLTREKFAKVICEYRQKPRSKGGGFLYTRDDLQRLTSSRTLAELRHHLKHVEPYPVGSLIGDVWVPLRRDRLEKLRGLLRRRHRASAAHDFSHLERVERIARMLAAADGADAELAAAMALVHDFLRPEGNGEEGAVELAAGKAEPLLRKAGFSAEEIGGIIRGIRSHSLHDAKALQPETPEEKILFDADKMDALGAVGVARWFAYAGKKGWGFDEAARIYLQTIDKFLEKHGGLHTPSADRIARERALLSRWFMEKLFKEVEG